MANKLNFEFDEKNLFQYFVLRKLSCASEIYGKPKGAKTANSFPRASANPLETRPSKKKKERKIHFSSQNPFKTKRIRVA